MRKPSMVPTEPIERAISVLRGRRVMLDADLATMYGVETKALVRAVKRNQERFPSDFMFQCSASSVDFIVPREAGGMHSSLAFLAASTTSGRTSNDGDHRREPGEVCRRVLRPRISCPH